MYTHLGIIDFEANCLEHKIIEPQEIIEFPIIVYDLVNRYIDYDKTFHYYCKINTPITDFCTQLTGITQKKVDNGFYFGDVMQKLDKWMLSNNWIYEDDDKTCTILFVTHGDWDLQTALPKQCKYSSIDIPFYLKSWCNLKTIYKNLYNKKGKGMDRMLKDLNMQLLGRHHSGIDDAKNIARIAQKLHQNGASFNVTSSLYKSYI